MNARMTINDLIDTQTDIPVKIFRLISDLNITIIPFDFTEIEKLLDQQNIPGIIYKKDDHTYFFYSEQLNDIERRVMVTYELIYNILYTDKIQKKFILPNNHKNHITQHMINLLVPQRSIKNLHKQFLVAPALTDLAWFYQVPEWVMQQQLDNVNLAYIKNKSFLF